MCSNDGSVRVSASTGGKIYRVTFTSEGYAIAEDEGTRLAPS
jgi:hypothetical protein